MKRKTDPPNYTWAKGSAKYPDTCGDLCADLCAPMDASVPELFAEARGEVGKMPTMEMKTTDFATA